MMSMWNIIEKEERLRCRERLKSKNLFWLSKDKMAFPDERFLFIRKILKFCCGKRGFARKKINLPYLPTPELREEL